MKKVIFLNINGRVFGPSPAAIVISHAIQKILNSELKLSIGYLDFFLNKHSLSEIFWHTMMRSPDYLLISVYLWNYEKVITLAGNFAKYLKHTKIILGGPAVGLLPDSLLKSVAYYTESYGENTLCFWLNHEFPEMSPIARLDPNDRPYTRRKDNYVRDFVNKSAICYDASRGCPFHCNFCTDGINNIEFRRNPQVIREELSELAKLQYKVFDIADNNANQNKNAFNIYTDFAVEHPENSVILTTRGEFFDEEMLEKICSIQNIQFFIGLQSLDHEVNKGADRTINIHKLFKLLDSPVDIHKRKSIMCLDLIFGLKNQDRKSFMNDFDLVTRLNPNIIQLNHLKAFSKELNNQFRTSGEGDFLSGSFFYEVIRSSHLIPEDFIWFQVFMEKVYHPLQGANTGNFATVLNYCINRKNGSPVQFYDKLVQEFFKNQNEFDLRQSVNKLIDAEFSIKEATALKDLLKPVVFSENVEMIRPGYNFSIIKALASGLI